MVEAMWCVGEANKRSNQVWLCHTELVSLCYVLFCLLLFKPREWVSRMKLRISQCLNVFLVVNSFKYQHQIKSQRNFIFHFRLVSRSVINHHVTYSTYLIPVSRILHHIHRCLIYEAIMRHFRDKYEAIMKQISIFYSKNEVLGATIFVHCQTTLKL